MDPKIDEILTEYWYDPTYPSAFSGFASFWKYLQDKKIKIDKPSVKEWLEAQDTYTLFHPQRVKFKRNKTYAWGPNWMYSIDLAHIPDLKYLASNHVWILVCIDSFTKYLWAKPMKTKSGEEVTKALVEIFSEKGPPRFLYADYGREFWNQNVAALLEKNNVHIYRAMSTVKAAHAEVAIKYLKRKIYKWAAINKKPGKYLETLQKLVSGKNNTPHSSHGFKPKDVNINNQHIVFEKLYPDFYKDQLPKNKPVFFQVGDKVRISKLRTAFQKGFRQTFTTEVFKVSNILLHRSPPTYKIQSMDGTDIMGTFYAQELVKINEASLGILPPDSDKKPEKSLTPNKSSDLTQNHGSMEKKVLLHS